jgi:predicted transcriptional regulator
MLKVIIRTESLEDFFYKARKTAQKADRGEFLKEEVTFSFEDSKEMFKVLSEVRRRRVLK